MCILKEYGLGENSYQVGDEVVAVVDEFIAYHKKADSLVDKEKTITRTPNLRDDLLSALRVSRHF